MGISSSLVARSAWIVRWVLPSGRDAHAVTVKNISWNSLYRGVFAMAVGDRDTWIPRVWTERVGQDI